jgi:Flp pilus assembly protein TadD
LVNALGYEKALNNRGKSLYCECLDFLGDTDKASRLRRKEIKKNPSDPIFYNDEAKSLANRGQFQEALNVLQQAESAGCMDKYSYGIKADVLSNLGQDAEALKVLDIADGLRLTDEKTRSIRQSIYKRQKQRQ